jgi:hypothetical protein
VLFKIFSSHNSILYSTRYSQQKKKKRLNEERKGQRWRLRRDEQISLGFVDRKSADDDDDGGTNTFHWGFVDHCRGRRQKSSTIATYTHQTLIAVCRSECPSPHYPTRHNFFFVSFVLLFFFLADEDQILFFPTNPCTTDDGGGGFLYVHALGCSCGWI